MLIGQDIGGGCITFLKNNNKYELKSKRKSVRMFKNRGIFNVSPLLSSQVIHFFFNFCTQTFLIFGENNKIIIQIDLVKISFKALFYRFCASCSQLLAADELSIEKSGSSNYTG